MTLEKNRRDQGAPVASTQGVPALEPLRSGPRTAISAAVAKRLFRAAVNRLDITVVEGRSGRRLGQGGPTMHIHRPDEFYARLGRDRLIGFGEAYMTGAWDAEDLAGFLTVPAARIATLIPEPLQRMRAFLTPRLPGNQRSTEANSQANISHHYDLSNEMFELFLDDTLSYSSALFDTSSSSVGAGPGSVGDHLVATPPEPGPSWEASGDPILHSPDLAEAQGRKIERLLDEAGVTDGTRVLEIGTGWGELAIRAARRGATVHSITLSVEQLELAEQRIAAAGFADRVTRRADGLPRARRHRSDVRRRAVRRDDRGRGPRVLGHLLPHDRPGPRPGRPGRDPGDHDAARPDARHPRRPDLDQQVHLPRRLPAERRGDRRDHPRRDHPAPHRPARDGQPLRRDPAPLGPPVPRAARRRARPRLRRPLHARVALLPRVLAGRLRQRLHQRLAADLHEGENT